MFTDVPLCFVDIETTGGSPYKNRIIEIGIIRYENGQITQTLNELINPERDVPKFILDLTGINQDDLQTAKPFVDLAPSVKQILAGSVFVAHNASFDYSFLRQEFGALGEIFKIDTLCSARLSMALFPYFKKHNLDAIIDRLNIRILNRHRAYDDAYVILKFFEKLYTDYDLGEVKTKIESLIKKPNSPLYLDEKDIDNLPKKHGVYLFYDKNNIPLYVNKAKNIKSTVFDHFYGNVVGAIDKKIAQNATNIESHVTTGYISALILQKELIKKLLPVYNKKSTYFDEYFYVISRKINGHITIEVLRSAIKPTECKILHVYKNKKQAQDFIENFVKSTRLCLHYVKYDQQKDSNSTAPCFHYHIELCNGVCAKKEPRADYNRRATEAIEKTLESERVNQQLPACGGNERSARPHINFAGRTSLSLILKEYDHENHNYCEYKINDWEIISKKEFYGDEIIEIPIGIPITDDDYKIMTKNLTSDKN